MRKIDYKYIISSKIKYLKARLKNGGRIEDYFRVKNKNESTYKKMIDNKISIIFILHKSSKKDND